jgi:hypothetical protein
VTAALTKPVISELPSLVLVCPSNCGSRSLTVVVQRPGEGRAEAGEVGAALVGVDVVREGVDGLAVGGGPLHRDLERGLGALGLEVDDVALHRVAGLVEMADEVLDAALVVVLDLLAVAAAVVERDHQAAGEERRLAEALRERLVVEVRLLEDLGVREEGHRRARVGGVAGADDRPERLAALEAHLVDAAVAAHLGHEPLGEGVDHRDADAVEAAGDLVAVAAELAAGVQDGHHDLERAPVALVGHGRDGDSAAVVGHGARSVRVQADRDPVAVPRERLVHAVVDHLVDQVVETARAGGPDVHARPAADRLQALEDGDVPGVVVRADRRSVGCGRDVLPPR